MDIKTQIRFWSKVKIPKGAADGPCWPWTAAQNGTGYGIFHAEGRNQVAHRIAYKLLVGPILAGQTIDHLCRNRACVNPSHLEAVSNRENILRGVGATAKNFAKEFCVKGHPLFGENVYYRPDRPGHRHCRECKRIRDKESYKADPAPKKAADAAYRAKHKEEIRAYQKEWYKRNREACIKRSHDHYHAHKDEINLKRREAYKKTPS